MKYVDWSKALEIMNKGGKVKFREWSKGTPAMKLDDVDRRYFVWDQTDHRGYDLEVVFQKHWFVVNDWFEVVEK